MKTKTLAALASVMIGISPTVFADNTYQATGPIVELTDSKIVILKSKEKWEIARTANTRITGELKVGAKVTIHYTMTATSVEVKPPSTAPSPAEKVTGGRKS